MRRQKILLYDLSQMFADLVEGVLAADDVEFVRAKGGFLGAVTQVRPDVAIVQAEHADGGLRTLLDAAPRMRLLVLTETGRRGKLYSLEPVSVTLADLTPRTLRGALRVGGAA